MDEQITLTNGDCSITVNPVLGARITAFALRGKNCLTTTGPQTGSTFWPSPQDFWGWPPPPVLDSQPYQATQVGDAWVFTSQPCSITGLVVAKIVRPAASGFEVEYKLHNATAAAVQFAPWEITRVDGGLTFYASSRAPESNSNLPIVAIGNSFWHDYQPAGFDQNLKLFANHSAGWLANVCYGLLLKKSFAPVAPLNVAPKEAEVEIYAHGDPENAYIEIEQQGEYTLIAPGDTLSWVVRWQLAELPVDLAVEIGNPDLLALAESL